MRLVFRHDPAAGCDCSLGEYRQDVRGFSERTDPGGRPQRGRVQLVGGLMDESTFREDARAGNPNLPYGHRQIGSRDGDEFLPDRATGCFYLGADEPGMTGMTPGQRMRFEFDFRGAAVDRRDRSTPIDGWHFWTVTGDYTIPMPTPPTPPTTPTPPTPPTPPTTPTPPRITAPPSPPYRGPTIGPASPTTSPPSPFCHGGRIACETLEFLQDRLRAHTFLTQADVNESVEVEHRVLLRTRRRPPLVDIHQAEDYWAWVTALRVEAHQRIRDFARDYFMPFPD